MCVVLYCVLCVCVYCLFYLFYLSVLCSACVYVLYVCACMCVDVFVCLWYACFVYAFIVPATNLNPIVNIVFLQTISMQRENHPYLDQTMARDVWLPEHNVPALDACARPL